MPQVTTYTETNANGFKIVVSQDLIPSEGYYYEVWHNGHVIRQDYGFATLAKAKKQAQALLASTLRI